MLIQEYIQVHVADKIRIYAQRQNSTLKRLFEHYKTNKNTLPEGVSSTKPSISNIFEDYKSATNTI